MDIYVFANQKGGVGKTTVTLGVAAELAARGPRVLLVDLDAQASATKALAFDVDGRCSMADVMLEPDCYALRDAIAATDWGFDLAPSETALASRESRRATADEFVLKRQLAECGRYDVVLVDCPPSLGVLRSTRWQRRRILSLSPSPAFLRCRGSRSCLRPVIWCVSTTTPTWCSRALWSIASSAPWSIARASRRSRASSVLIWSGRRCCPSGQCCRTPCGEVSLFGAFAAAQHRSSPLTSVHSPTGSGLRVASAEPRRALGSRRPARPHPASPAAPRPAASALGDGVDGGLVMFCVRVEPSLRRRVKLAAVASGCTIQRLAVEALEDGCRRHEA